MIETLSDLYINFFGASVAVAPEFLLLSILAAWIIYRLRRQTNGFWTWLLPKEIYTHESHWLDLKLFAIGRLAAFSGFFGRISLLTVSAYGSSQIFSDGLLGSNPPSPIVLALILWIVSDCAAYWIHRIHHSQRVLWSLHAVHHSAQVMSPFTAYRQHPLGYLITVPLHSVLIGVAQGLLIGPLAPETAIAQIAGVNAFIVLANIAMANFHHSHIWISFGPLLERIIISPAQHQIHHSDQSAHYNKNYGQTLALWDWMFGTLFVIRRKEQLSFGLGDMETKKMGDHRLVATLLYPFRSQFRRFGKSGSTPE
ncbi:sterol desaturase family protein [Parasedimentitalea psychrophila]|uniref:Sterol desaturase family protein n=1 Tax=Parasedimentitalea psychrophila TaxID=2997337 RepID=A0A9Y2KUK5_9RHOB|nr:sterol desaturase family protein [Parasedimentitalea psychrophila]WIY23420.1 sterol desaturase family protein [Parasedimentitalea psychrophila]